MGCHGSRALLDDRHDGQLARMHVCRRTLRQQRKPLSLVKNKKGNTSCFLLPWLLGGDYDRDEGDVKEPLRQ